MKTVIINQYGSPDELKVVTMSRPELKPDEVLIKNVITTVNPWDCMVRSGSMKLFTGRKFPKILGTESSGIVEQMGSNVARFKKGDRVIAMTGLKTGSYAEYITIHQNSVVALPDNTSFEQGATLTVAASTAYNVLHELAKIKEGDKILINGAYGGVGTFAVQLAKLAGANVTAVCSTRYIDKVKELGADKVLDYTKENLLSGQKYDSVFDTVSKLQFKQVKKILAPHGIMINTLPTPKAMVTQLWTSFQSKKFKTINNRPSAATIKILADLVANRQVKVIIDKEYLISQLPEAHKYIETGRAKGKVLIRFE